MSERRKYRKFTAQQKTELVLARCMARSRSRSLRASTTSRDVVAPAQVGTV